MQFYHAAFRKSPVRDESKIIISNVQFSEVVPYKMSKGASLPILIIIKDNSFEAKHEQHIIMSTDI